MVPSSGLKNTSGTSLGMDKLPQEMSDMKIRDDKVDDQHLLWLRHVMSFLYGNYLNIKVAYMTNETSHMNFYDWFDELLQEVEATVINGKGTEAGHIIVTTINGKNGQPKKVNIINEHKRSWGHRCCLFLYKKIFWVSRSYEGVGYLCWPFSKMDYNI